MFCPQCGKEKITEANFCSSCGHSYEAVSTTEYLVARKFPTVIVAILLIFALFAGSVEIGYFTFLRWVVTASSVYYLYVIYKNIHRWSFWVWVFILLAILFNPIVPVYLDRDTWQFFDFLALILFSIYFFRLRKGKIV
jgi:hypothetical protein